MASHHFLPAQIAPCGIYNLSAAVYIQLFTWFRVAKTRLRVLNSQSEILRGEVGWLMPKFRPEEA